MERYGLSREVLKGLYRIDENGVSDGAGKVANMGLRCSFLRGGGQDGSKGSAIEDREEEKMWGGASEESVVTSRQRDLLLLLAGSSAAP